VGETSDSGRHLFLGLAVARLALALAALPLAPWLYREHAAALVALRPTKEVFLFAGFVLSEGDSSLLAVVGAALPILLGGVWVFFGLGRAYADALDDELPGVTGRLLPKDRIDRLQQALEERGTKLVFLGRLAAFPSTLTAAAAGSSGMAWREFVLADTAGALVSLGALLALGFGLQETYESAGVWVTAAGIAVLVAGVVLLGRSLSSPVRGGTATRSARTRLATSTATGPS
jgi:membrane protein DedA with SNARE-associated domain